MLTFLARAPCQSSVTFARQTKGNRAYNHNQTQEQAIVRCAITHTSPCDDLIDSLGQ